MAQQNGVSRSGDQPDGPAIRRLRIQRKLRLAPAADLVGCHPKTLSRIERGVRGASPVMLQQIADAFGVKPEQIKRKARAA